MKLFIFVALICALIANLAMAAPSGSPFGPPGSPAQMAECRKRIPSFSIVVCGDSCGHDVSEQVCLREYTEAEFKAICCPGK